jgi:hypothetical protein
MTQENPWIQGYLHNGDMAVAIAYRRNADGSAYEWVLTGTPSPEKTLLQACLRSAYEQIIQQQLRNQETFDATNAKPEES